MIAIRYHEARRGEQGPPLRLLLRQAAAAVRPSGVSSVVQYVNQSSIGMNCDLILCLDRCRKEVVRRVKAAVAGREWSELCRAYMWRSVVKLGLGQGREAGTGTRTRASWRLEAVNAPFKSLHRPSLYVGVDKKENSWQCVYMRLSNIETKNTWGNNCIRFLFLFRGVLLLKYMLPVLSRLNVIYVQSVQARL